MSNFEDRFVCTEPKKTAIDTLQDFNFAKTTRIQQLKKALAAVQYANKQSVYMGDSKTPALTLQLFEEIERTTLLRASRDLINQVNIEIEEAKNDRLRRAGDINSSSETISSSRRARDAPAIGHSFLISVAPTTEDNNTGPQSSSQMVRKQIHTTQSARTTSIVNHNRCPVCTNVYGDNRIGYDCNNCGNTLPSF